jgi:ribosomal protein S18 acetylase RimI-like enzyme
MTDNKLSIEKVTAADADALLAFSKKTFFDFWASLNTPEDMEAYAAITFTPQKVQSEVNNINSYFYFAVLEGEIAGYLKLNYGLAQTEFQDPNALEVERIYVLAEHHGKKIGHQLLDFSINQAIDNGLQYVWLGVWEHNHKALKFYEKHGFKTFSRHDFMLGSDKQTDFLMKKELAG